VGLVVQQVLDVLVSHVVDQTCLLILDFLGNDIVIVVVRGVFDEAFVQHCFQEDVEIVHEASVVTISVLVEQRNQTVVCLFGLLVFLFGCNKFPNGRKTADNGQTPQEADATLLKEV
jgi:hypothetical protein